MVCPPVALETSVDKPAAYSVVSTLFVSFFFRRKPFTPKVFTPL